MTDPCLQIENFTETKRKNILQKYGDMRIKGALELRKMWYNLDENKQHFIPDILDLFLKVALIPIKQINDAIIPLFFDMMSTEMILNQNIENNESIFDELRVPNKLVTHLDSNFENGAGDNVFRDSFKIMYVFCFYYCITFILNLFFFFNRFTDKFSKDVNFCQYIDFVNKIVDLIDLLIEYRDFKKNFDASDELNTFYLNELMV